MAHFEKTSIICPVCGYKALKIKPLPDLQYRCGRCRFASTDENCVDVSYKDNLSSPLSNLYPHTFVLYGFYPNNKMTREELTCPSMESFLQSLKIKDPVLQYVFMHSYSSMDAKRMSEVLDGWKNDQILYFAGKEFKRDSSEYDELITKAYDALYDTNPVFRDLVLPRFKGYHIIHTIGSDNKSDTLLTETEFRYQINRLIARLDK